MSECHEDKKMVMVVDDKRSGMKHIAGMLSMFHVMTNSGAGLVSLNRHFEEKEKKCLRCGESHFHHNSFCSAECCKAYKKGG